MKRNYIGLATSLHDPSIAIVNSQGEVVFAEASERYLQNKRATLVSPDQFIYYITPLIRTYVEPGAELVVAHSWSDQTVDILTNNLNRINEAETDFGKNNSEAPLFFQRHMARDKYILHNSISTIRNATTTLEFIFCHIEELNEYRNFQVKRYEHHLTHAATACYTSPFGEACCAILDGAGETRAYNCYHYQDGQIRQLPGIKDELGSLGIYYEKVCETCGFDWVAGEEWKVMGLAAYGQFDQQLYDLLKSSIAVEGLNLRQCSDQDYFFFLKKMAKLKRKKGEPALTAANLAYTGQLVFTEILFDYLKNLYSLGLSNNLIMGGGCCLNSSANGMVTEKTGFKNLHVFSAPADDGNSIGAALLAYYEDHPDQRKTPVVQSPYLGSELSKHKLEQLKRFGNFKKMTEHPQDIHHQAAKLLADGKIIGWVQGKAEFGPRALGNRSILADPRILKISSTTG
jgi:carbamoyltransferase